MNLGPVFNEQLNGLEYTLGESVLKSTPPNVIFASTYKCNMNCVFCFDRGDQPDFSLEVCRNFWETKLSDVISNASKIYYVGWGEVLLLPQVGEFLDYLNRRTPSSEKFFNTNGSPLTDEVIAKLFEGNYSLQISLHAGNALLHRMLTGSQKFEYIENQLKKLMKIKKDRNLDRPWVGLIFVLNSINIEHLPDFVEYAAFLGVSEVLCHYLTIHRPNHAQLSCFFKQDITNRMLDLAQERARQLGLSLILPLRFGATPQKDPLPCKDPWTHALITVKGEILPCCYAGKPIGQLNDQDFMSIWNGPEYVKLRRSLLTLKPAGDCAACSKFEPVNINHIQAHITNRLERAWIFEKLGLREGATEF